MMELDVLMELRWNVEEMDLEPDHRQNWLSEMKVGVRAWVRV